MPGVAIGPNFGGWPGVVGVSGGRLSLNHINNANPLYIAHAAGSWLAPEETAESYARVTALGCRAIEQDVRALSDGALALMHDATVDRTTTGTGNVSALNTAGFLALAIDAETQNIPGWGDAVSPILFGSVLSAYKGRQIFVPEVKATAVKQTLVDALLAAGIRKDQALVQAATVSDLAPAITAGYQGCYVGTTTDTEIATVQGAGATWAAISDTASDAVISAWVAAGFKVLIYSVSRRKRRDQLLALGVVGLFADDPIYVSSNAAAGSSDTFSDGKWPLGMIPTRGNRLATSSGVISSGGIWGWPTANSTNADFVVQGWAAPRSSATWQLDFEMRINEVNGGDANRWGGLILPSNDFGDLSWGEGLSTDAGYRCLLSKAGTLQIARRDGASATQLQAKSVTAPDLGAWNKMRLNVTASSITWALLDSGGSVVDSCTTSDSTYPHASLVHLGRAGAGVEFRNVVFS